MANAKHIDRRRLCRIQSINSDYWRKPMLLNRRAEDRQEFDSFDKKLVTGEKKIMTFRTNSRETFDTIIKHLKCREGDIQSDPDTLTITINHTRIFSRIIEDLQVNEDRLNILVAEN